MRIALKVAITLYCFVGLLLILGGLNYAFVSEYLPYHERATGVPWAALGPEHQGIYLGLMKGGGAGGITVGLALVLLSVFGLGQRTAAAFWILPLLALTYLTTMNYATYYMNSTTQGGPPLGVGMSLMGISLVAGILSYLGRAPRFAA